MYKLRAVLLIALLLTATTRVQAKPDLGTDEPGPFAPLNDNALCKPTQQAVSGYQGSTIPVTQLVYEALRAQKGFESEDFSFILSGGGGKGAPGVALLFSLMKNYYAAHTGDNDRYPLSNLGLMWPSDLPKKPNLLAAEVYGSLRKYLMLIVFNPKHVDRFAINPNVSPMTSSNWGTLWRGHFLELKSQKADWILWHIANGENYQIGCGPKPTGSADDRGDHSPASTDPKLVSDASVDHAVASSEAVPAVDPAEDPTAIKRHPSNTSYTPDLTDAGVWHVSGERDDLALAAFQLTDPLVTSPSFTVTPSSGTTGKGSTYNYNAQAVLGITVRQLNCDFTGPCKSPYQLNVFADAFYGQDKNAPKVTGGQNQIIDREGLGANFAVRFDPEFDPDHHLNVPLHRWAVLLQLIPEYVTDSQFKGKTLYFEARADFIDAPEMRCGGGDSVALPWVGLNFKCGFAAIADIADALHDGDESFLHQNFVRLGGEVGVAFSPAPNFCPDWTCKDLTSRIGLSAWYKELYDTSNHHASAHNFTSQFSFRFLGDDGGSKNVSFTAQYTDGIEDITLFKLPTWSLGIKGSF